MAKVEGHAADSKQCCPCSVPGLIRAPDHNMSATMTFTTAQPGSGVPPLGAGLPVGTKTASEIATKKHESIEEATDEVLIRAAVENSTVNALRLALYQLTGDSDLETMDVSKVPVRGGAMEDFVLAKDDEAIVKEKAIEYLFKRKQSSGATNMAASEPLPKQDAERLMRMFCGKGEDLSDAMVQLGYEELAFEDFPRAVSWTKQPPPERLSLWRVVVIGAGINGISTAISLQRLGIDYTVIDRQSDIGGTWYQNTYPEARVDTLGYSFQYKFEKGYRWKDSYPSAPELRNYLAYVAHKHDVAKNIRFEREVIAAKWDDASSKWDITLKTPDGSTEQISANAIISAGGLFATANLPDIPGIRDYKGKMNHTTEWDHSFDWEHKKIAVIGNGSSGAQLIPGLARKAGRLAIYQRTPQWIAPYEGYRSEVPRHLSWIIEEMPYYANWFGYSNFMRGMQLPPLQVDDPGWRAQGGKVNKRNDFMRDGLSTYIKTKVNNDPDLVKKLTPNSAPLVRRLVVDNGYYDAIMRDDVDLVTEGIEKFTPTGIRTNDGIERPFDLVVLACGFKPTEYLFPCSYEGRNGVTLDETWKKDGARSYLGLTIPGYPNLFTLYGPNHQPRGGPSLHSWSEIWGRYAVAAIVSMVENGTSSMEVKQDVYDAYNKDLDVATSKLIWEAEGRGYFVNKHGRQAVNMPWTADQYHPYVMKPDLADFHVS